MCDRRHQQKSKEKSVHEPPVFPPATTFRSEASSQRLPRRHQHGLPRLTPRSSESSVTSVDTKQPGGGSVKRPISKSNSSESGGSENGGGTIPVEVTVSSRVEVKRKWPLQLPPPASLKTGSSGSGSSCSLPAITTCQSHSKPLEDVSGFVVVSRQNYFKPVRKKLLQEGRQPLLVPIQAHKRSEQLNNTRSQGQELSEPVRNNRLGTNNGVRNGHGIECVQRMQTIVEGCIQEFNQQALESRTQSRDKFKAIEGWIAIQDKESGERFVASKTSLAPRADWGTKGGEYCQAPRHDLPPCGASKYRDKTNSVTCPPDVLSSPSKQVRQTTCVTQQVPKDCNIQKGELEGCCSSKMVHQQAKQPSVIDKTEKCLPNSAETFQVEPLCEAVRVGAQQNSQLRPQKREVQRVPLLSNTLEQIESMIEPKLGELSVESRTRAGKTDLTKQVEKVRRGIANQSKILEQLDALMKKSADSCASEVQYECVGQLSGGTVVVSRQGQSKSTPVDTVLLPEVPAKVEQKSSRMKENSEVIPRKSKNWNLF